MPFTKDDFIKSQADKMREANILAGVQQEVTAIHGGARERVKAEIERRAKIDQSIPRFDVPDKEPSFLQTSPTGMGIPFNVVAQNPFDEAIGFLSALRSGTVEGLTGIDVAASEHEREKFGFTAGELLGYTAPIPGAKALRAASFGMKALKNPLARRIVSGVITGAAFETQRQLGKTAVGQETNWDDVLWTGLAFGGFEGGVSLGGKLGKHLLSGVKPSIASPKPWVRPPKDFGPANRTLVRSKNVTGAPNVQLEAPSVSWGEHASMKEIPIWPEAERPIGKLWDWAAAGLETAPRLMKRFGVKEIMYDPIKEAEFNATMATKEGLAAWRKTLKEQGIGWAGKAESNRRLWIHATARQKGGLKALKDSGVDIDNLPAISAQEENVYNYVRGWMEQAYKDITKSRQAGGIEPFGKVDDYFTFFRQIQGQVDDGAGVLGSSFRTAEKTPFRYSNKRPTDNYGPLSQDFFGVFEKYMESAQKHIHMTPTLSKMRQLLKGQYNDNFVLQNENPVAHKALNSWVNFVAGEVNTQLDRTVESGMRLLNRNLAFSTLSFNLRSAFIQPSALVNSMTEIGTRNTLYGIRGLFSRKQRRFALKNSRHLSVRQIDATMSEAYGGLVNKVGAAQQKAGALGLKPLAFLDNESAIATWLGAHRKAKSLGLSGKGAYTYADDAVITTQASAALSDRSPIQRTAAGKAATLFQTFVINNWGFLTNDVLGVAKGGRGLNGEAFGKVARYIAGATMMNTLYEDVLGSYSPFPNPLGAYKKAFEKKGDGWDAARAAFMEAGEIIPLVGGSIRYGSSPLGAGFQALGNLFGNDYRAPGLVEGVARVAGVPGVAQVKKLWRQAKGRKKKSGIVTPK